MLQNFSSLPPEQEREFVVFEQRLQSTSKSAITIGAIAGGLLGLLIVGIVLSGSEPPPLIEVEEPAAEAAAAPSRPAAEPPAPAPTEEAAAADEAVAEGEGEGEGEGEAAAEAPEAPPPPPGATKAPPTALTGNK